MRTTTPIIPQSSTSLTGYTVYTSDHEEVGRIVAVGRSAMDGANPPDASVLHVRPGIVQRLVQGADEVVVPERLVRMVQPHAKRVILQVPKAELRPPASPAGASPRSRAA